MSGYAWYNVYGVPVSVGTEEGVYTTLAGDFGTVTWKDANTLTLEKVPKHLGDILSVQFVAVVQMKDDAHAIVRSSMESNTRFTFDQSKLELTVSGGKFEEGMDVYNITMTGAARVGSVAVEVDPVIDEENHGAGSVSYTFTLAPEYNVYSLFFSALVDTVVTVDALVGYDEAVDPDDPPDEVYGPCTLAHFSTLQITLPGSYFMDMPKATKKVRVTCTYADATNESTMYLTRGRV